MAFYGDVLGFELVEQMGAAFARVRRDDLTLWLRGPTSSAARPMPDGAASQRLAAWNAFVIEVDDIEAQVARLTRSSCHLFANEIVTGPGGKQMRALGDLRRQPDRALSRRADDRATPPATVPRPSPAPSASPR